MIEYGEEHDIYVENIVINAIDKLYLSLPKEYRRTTLKEQGEYTG